MRDAALIEVRLLESALRVLLRLSTVRESAHEFLSDDYYAKAVLRERLVHVPLLLDAAAIYGSSAGETLSRVIHNFFRHVPPLRDELIEALPRAASTLRGVAERADKIVKRSEATDVVAFVHDSVHTLRAFCLAYEPALELLTDELFVALALAVEHVGEKLLSRVFNADGSAALDTPEAKGDDIDDAVAELERHRVLAQRAKQHAAALIALAMRAQAWRVATGADREDDLAKPDREREQRAAEAACRTIVALGDAGPSLLCELATIDDFAGRIVDMHIAHPGKRLCRLRGNRNLFVLCMFRWRLYVSFGGWRLTAIALSN